MRGRIRWQPPKRKGYQIAEWEIEPRATALLFLDLQVAHLDPDRGAGPALRSHFAEQASYYYGRVQSQLLPAVRALQPFFREHHLPVIHACSGLALPDGRELASWSWRSKLIRRPEVIPQLLPPGSAERAIWPELAPEPDDLVLIKQTLSPFNGTALDQYLRNMGIENLVIAGVLTNGAVETTARNAGDRGFNAIVVEDGCAALSQEDHQAGTAFASWFAVKSAAETMEELGRLLAK